MRFKKGMTTPLGTVTQVQSFGERINGKLKLVTFCHLQTATGEMLLAFDSHEDLALYKRACARSRKWRRE